MFPIVSWEYVFTILLLHQSCRVVRVAISGIARPESFEMEAYQELNYAVVYQILTLILHLDCQMITKPSF